MFSKKLLVCTALALAGVTAVTAAQKNAVLRGKGTTLWGEPARMTVVTKVAAPTFTRSNTEDPGVVTIFNNLATKYPKGEYWCCTGYNIMGPNSGAGEQWMAAAFTSFANHTVTKIEVAVGWSQQGTNGVVVSLNEDNHGVPGKALKTWNASGLPRFGTCCAVVVKTDGSGIPVSGGQQYWIVLRTNRNQMDTVDAWNVIDTNQVDPATVATFPGNNNQWNAFQTTPGLAFAVKGSN